MIDFFLGAIWGSSLTLVAIAVVQGFRAKMAARRRGPSTIRWIPIDSPDAGRRGD